MFLMATAGLIRNSFRQRHCLIRVAFNDHELRGAFTPSNENFFEWLYPIPARQREKDRINLGGLYVPVVQRGSGFSARTP